MQIFDGILTDRGSKYAVSGGPVTSRADAQELVKSLCKDRKFAKATHNTWGVVLEGEGPVKNDDGESGAGMVILRMLGRAELRNHIVVVTRWYGGKKLGGDRFRRVQDAVRYYLENRDGAAGAEAPPNRLSVGKL
ncbi:YigZ family protein [Sedimentitalea sp.]|uniref:YigZ family protein n=1 Tax=Sedimentitalea sp. TaxID=2048915 RepID=UPI0032975FD9